ncbi:MAG: ARMT1-like domain-containing protein [Planctomycetota bacterium]
MTLTPHQDTGGLVPLPLLADPAGYRPCPLDLSQREENRRYWLALFRGHFPTLLDAYRAEADDRGVDAETIEATAAEAQQRFDAHLDRLADDPAAFAPLTILDICTAREDVLRSVGIDDAYRLAKRRDTEHAVALLPELLDQLDAMPDAERAEAVVRGVFAGNIYDLGATETVAMFTDQRVDFHAVRQQLRPRPWRFDDLDVWLERLAGPPHRTALLFVDNAGPDVTLGMLPLARDLLRRGTDVILTANTTPSLNDVTHDELTGLVERVATFDPVVRDAASRGRLTLTPSGNHTPLIDLSRVDPRLAAACGDRGVDLVVLEGMGRAVESNLDAELRCDTLKLAMIKDGGVARELGTEVFDLVMKFEPTGRQ